MRLYNISLSTSDLFQLAQYPLGLSIVSQMANCLFFGAAVHSGWVVPNSLGTHGL